MNSDASSEKSYRWLECEHPDLQMHNVPNPFPWPAEEPPPEKSKDFAAAILVAGIDAYLADIAPKRDAKWEGLRTVYAEIGDMIQALESGDLETAGTMLRRHYALDGGSAYACFNMAFVLKQMHATEDALEFYQKALAKWPEMPRVSEIIGGLLEDEGRKEEARVAYERALKENPNDRAIKDALTRVGTLRRMQRRTEKNDLEECYVPWEEFAKAVRNDIAELSKRGATDKLQRTIDSLLEMGEGVLLAEAVKACRNLGSKDRRIAALSGEALRLQGKNQEAVERFGQILEKDEANAWAHFYLAYALWGVGDQPGYWREIDTTLAHDVNHYGAIVAKFKLGAKQQNPAVLAEVVRWAEEQKSWQGFLLASMTAKNIDDAKQELLLAERGYKLAPSERNMLLKYTQCLNDCEEREWVAAVIKPVLVAGQGDYQLKFVFAGALHNLGLKEEAIKLLEETLATDRAMSEDWMRGFQRSLDFWRGLRAKSEEKVLTFDGEVLRGGIVVILDGEERGELIGGGTQLPTERPMDFDKFSSTTRCVGFQQGAATEKASPHALGYFIVRELDPERLPKERLRVIVEVTRHLRLEACAWQGERRLPVEWSLYPVPVFESGQDNEGEN